MQLDLDTNNHRYSINAVDDGEVKINDTPYHRSLIVAKDTLITDWLPQSFEALEALEASHLDPIFTLSPSIVLLGTGKTHQFLSPELMSLFLSRNIGIEVMDTRAACRTFNVLMSENRDAVAALLIEKP